MSKIVCQCKIETIETCKNCCRYCKTKCYNECQFSRHGIFDRKEKDCTYEKED